MALAGLALAVFGFDSWRDYVGLTLPVLSQLERYGTGAFMHMMPSVFMALRIFGVPGDPALYIHLAFAALMLIVLAAALKLSRDPLAQAAMLLIGTALATPYLHSYDLAMVTCGALLLARQQDRLSSIARIALFFPVVLAWGLPNIVMRFNAMGAPVSPVILVVLFGTAVALSLTNDRRVSPLAVSGHSR